MASTGNASETSKDSKPQAVPSLDIADTKALEDRLLEVDKKILKSKISSLFNEELDRSRNGLLLVTFLSITFLLVDVQQLEILGVKLSVKSGTTFTFALFFAFLIYVFAEYYLVNAYTDHLSKEMNLQTLKRTLNDAIEYFKEKSEDLEKKVAEAGLMNENTVVNDKKIADNAKLGLETKLTNTSRPIF